MKILILISLNILLISSCSSKSKGDEIAVNKNFDTIVGQQIESDLSTFKTTQYFLIVNRDTSAFSCSFTVQKETGNINLSMKPTSLELAKTHALRLQELKVILKQASKDYDFNNLHSIYIGRLSNNGDLAIDVSRDFAKQFKDRVLPAYKVMGEFLAQSKLGKDVDDLLQPYALKTNEISIEKLFLMSSKNLYSKDQIETKEADIPANIVDCSVSVLLKKSRL